MILFDAHQAVIAATAKATSDFKSDVTESDVRHYFLRLVNDVMKKNGAEFGKEAVLAFDSFKGYWRKDEFPFYKYKRKDAKASMPFDMDFAKECSDKFYRELDEQSHFRCVRVDGAEGDDVIGAIVMAKAARIGELVDAATMTKFLIVSSDEDFPQLQKYPGVGQWSNKHKRLIVCENPKRELFELIVRGDDGDSVPNVTSEDDIYVTKARRQTPITVKKLDMWWPEYCESGGPHSDIATYWNRNKRMVDLSEIPATLQGQIIEAYEAAKHGSKTDFLNYLTAKQVKGFENDMQFF